MAKRKSSSSSRKHKGYTAADHERFKKDLLANDEARAILAAWLQQRGWIVETLKPLTVAATAAEWANHSDSGDVWATKGDGPRTRFEVKQRTINFTGAHDFPFPDCVICRCSGFERAIIKPAFIVLFNSSRSWAAVIDAGKWRDWRREKKTDTRHNDLTQEFFVTDLQNISFQQIPYELSKAGELAKAREEADRRRCGSFHADPRCWKTEEVEGRQRVSCQECGKFIGYKG